ncbi:glycosyltransferase family 2 protein [Flagellimonas flava]|uniref:Glycosyltransferase involved in cell wall bisynthesis n=1 Tax=Flagellimonas flava TaxID=570519 RepID=A0A1M5J7G1_9FLAO|nr:glycosyltransferase family 2 protein [Allomuricauda flava]SHG36498.1 Glycosyltransferase involved in cell wall bisynthesis [Allomuricauda flava]
MKEVEISVIVPIHNIEPYLPKCIDSLLVQSFTNFELILVDNGSPDNCPEICDRYASTDDRIKVIHKVNEGLLSARKAGLEKAQGKYIAYVDGDDWVDIFYLDTLYKMAKANDSDMVVTGHFREFDGKIETIKPLFTGNFDQSDIESSILPNAIYNGRFCEHNISTYVWNKLFKRELLITYVLDIPNDIIMGEDAAITYTYLTLSKRITICDIPIYYYRQRPDSIVKSIEDPEMEYRRLSLLLVFLRERLSPYLSEENLKSQLTYYLYSLILVRSGGLIANNSNNTVFNPFLGTEKKSRIVVYSSGSFGQHILSTNARLKFFQIVRWIDIDFHSMTIDGNSVQPIGAIDNNEFDFLIIGTTNPTYYEQIKSNLELVGINANKIVQIGHDETEVLKLLDNLGFNSDFSRNLNVSSKRTEII